MSSLKTRLRNRYNCSVAETDHKDRWARSKLAICVVSDESGHVSSQLNEIIRFASQDKATEIDDYYIETF